MLFVNVNLNLNVNIERNSNHKSRCSQKNYKLPHKKYSNSQKQINLKEKCCKESTYDEFFLNPNNMKFEKFDPFSNLKKAKTNKLTNVRSLTAYNNKHLTSNENENKLQKYVQYKQQSLQNKDEISKIKNNKKISLQIKKPRSYTNCVNRDQPIKNLNKNFNPFIIANNSKLNFANTQKINKQLKQIQKCQKNQSTSPSMIKKVKSSRNLSYNYKNDQNLNNKNEIQLFKKIKMQKQSDNIKKQFGGLFIDQRKKMNSSKEYQRYNDFDSDNNTRQKELLAKKNQQKLIQKINRNYDHLGRLIKKRLKLNQVNFNSDQKDEINTKNQQTPSFKKFNFIPMRRSMQMQLQECLNSNLNAKNSNNINFCDNNKFIQNNLTKQKIKNNLFYQHNYNKSKSNDLNLSNIYETTDKNQNTFDNDRFDKNIHDIKSSNNSNCNKNTSNNNSNNKLHQSLLNYLTDIKILKETESILGIEKSRVQQQKKQKDNQKQEKKNKNIKSLGRYHSNHGSYQQQNIHKNYLNFHKGDNIFEDGRKKLIKKHKEKKYLQLQKLQKQQNGDQNQVLGSFLQFKTAQIEQDFKFKSQNQNKSQKSEISIQNNKEISMAEHNLSYFDQKKKKQQQKHGFKQAHICQFNQGKNQKKNDLKAQLLVKQKINKIIPKNSYDLSKNIFCYGEKVGTDQFIQENSQSINKINQPFIFQDQSQLNENHNFIKNTVYFISSKLSYKFVSLFTIQRIAFRVQKKPNIQSIKSKQQKKQTEKTYIIEITLQMYNQIVVQRIRYTQKNIHFQTSKKFKPIVFQKNDEKNLQKENIKSYLFSQLFVNKNYSCQYQPEHQQKMKQSLIQNQKSLQKKEKESPHYLKISSQKFNPSSRISLESNRFLQVKKDSLHKQLSGNILEVKSSNHHRYSSMSYNSVTTQCYEKIVEYIQKFCIMEISYLGISLRQIQSNSQPNILKQIMKKKHSQIQQTLLQTFNLAQVFYHLLKINKTFYVGKCVKIKNKVKFSLLYEFSNLVRHTKSCIIQLQEVLDKSTNKLRNDQLSKYLYDRMIIKFSEQMLNNNRLKTQNQEKYLKKYNTIPKNTSIKKQSLLDALQICFGKLKQIRKTQCDDQMIYKIYQTNYKNQIKWKRQQYKFYSGISNNFFVYHGAFDFCFMTQKQRQKNANVLMSSYSSQCASNNQSLFKKNMKNSQYKHRKALFSYYLTKKFELFINYEETRNIMVSIQDQFTKEQFLLLHLHKLYKDQYKCSQILDTFLEKSLIQSMIQNNNKNINKIDCQKTNTNVIFVNPSSTKNSSHNFSVIHKNDFFSETSLFKENFTTQNQLTNDKTQQKGQINIKTFQKQFYKTIDNKSNIIKVFIKDYDQQNNKWLSESPLDSKILIKVYSRISFRCYDLSLSLNELFNHLKYFYSMKTNKKVYGKNLTNLQIVITNKTIDVLQFRQKLDFYVKKLKLIRKNVYSQYYFNFTSSLSVNKLDSNNIFSQKFKNTGKNSLNNSMDRENKMFQSFSQKNYKNFNKNLKGVDGQPIITVLYKCLKKVFHGFFVIITLSKIQIFNILEFKVYVNKVHKSFVHTIQQSIGDNISFQVLTNIFFNFLKNTYFRKILQKQSNKLSKKYKQFYSHMINQAQTAFISKTRKNKQRGIPNSNSRRMNRRSQCSEIDDISFSELTQEIISVNFHSKRKNKYLIRVTYLSNNHYISERKGIDETINVNIYRQNSMLIYKFVTNARRLLSKKFSKEHNLYKLQYQEKTKPYCILADEVKYLIQQSNQTTYGLLAAFKRYFLDKNYNNLATNHMISCFSIKMLAGIDFNKLFSQLTSPIMQSQNSLQNTNTKLQQQKSIFSHYPKQNDYIFSDNQFNIRSINSDCYERYCIFVQKFQMIQVLKVRDKQDNYTQTKKYYHQTHDKSNRQNAIANHPSFKNSGISIFNMGENNAKSILNRKSSNSFKKQSKPRHSIDFRLQQENEDKLFINKNQKYLSPVKQNKQNQQEIFQQTPISQQYLQQNQCEKIVYLINKETQMIKQITQWNQGSFLSIIPFRKYNKKMFFRMFKNLTYENQEYIEKQLVEKDE